MKRYCTNCGHELGETTAFCTECGQKVPPLPTQGTSAPKEDIFEKKAAAPAAVRTETKTYAAPAPAYAPAAQQDTGSKVVSVLAFLGLMILFALPVIGFIASLIFALVPGNKNIRHYAIAALIIKLIGALVFIGFIFLVKALVGMAIDAVSKVVETLPEQFEKLNLDPGISEKLGELPDLLKGLFNGSLDPSDIESWAADMEKWASEMEDIADDFEESTGDLVTA